MQQQKRNTFSQQIKYQKKKNRKTGYSTKGRGSNLQFGKHEAGKKERKISRENKVPRIGYVHIPEIGMGRSVCLLLRRKLTRFIFN